MMRDVSESEEESATKRRRLVEALDISSKDDEEDKLECENWQALP